MDLIARAVEKKIIDEKVYRDLAVKTTKNLLESYGYKCGKTVGEGTFGEIIEIENVSKSTKVAAKIVLNRLTTKGETDMWKNLKSDYLLPLLGQVSFIDAPTTVFFSPICQGNLYDKINDETFMQEQEIFNILKNHLNDIVRGLAYIHDQNLNHLDLKLTNILIKKDGRSCICDFGCICASDSPVNSYASPYYYRPPEAQLTSHGQTFVNGIKYDIWTLGVLALELFTRRIFSKAIWKATRGNVFNWNEQIYPVLFYSLQDCNFEEFIRRSSSKSKLSREKALIVKDFITGCLNPNPEARPSCSELLNHKLFGGTYECISPMPSDDIWNKYANYARLERMALIYRERIEFKIEKVPMTDDCKGDRNVAYVDKVDKDLTNVVPEEGDIGASYEVNGVDNIPRKKSKRKKIGKWFQEKFTYFGKLFSRKK